MVDTTEEQLFRVKDEPRDDTNLSTHVAKGSIWALDLGLGVRVQPVGLSGHDVFAAVGKEVSAHYSSVCSSVHHCALCSGVEQRRALASGRQATAVVLLILFNFGNFTTA